MSLRAPFVRIVFLSLISAQLSFAAQNQVQPETFNPTVSSLLAPVYAPLAEQIVRDYHLADKKGVGIDLGSGPGVLIIELCKRTTNLHWINADINPRFFPGFLQTAREAGSDNRVSAIYADAQALPFHDHFADVIVTRSRKVKQFFSVRGQKYPYPENAVDGVVFREFFEVPYFFSVERSGTNRGPEFQLGNAQRNFRSRWDH